MYLHIMYSYYILGGEKFSFCEDEFLSGDNKEHFELSKMGDVEWGDINLK